MNFKILIIAISLSLGLATAAARADSRRIVHVSGGKMAIANPICESEDFAAALRDAEANARKECGVDVVRVGDPERHCQIFAHGRVAVAQVEVNYLCLGSPAKR